MPFEADPFNGDTFIEAEVLRLKARHDLKAAAETGTCYGSTTLWLGDNFHMVATCEIVDQYRAVAKQRRRGHKNAPNMIYRPENSPEFLKKVIPAFAEGGHLPALFFLDAHWGPNCPLLDELTAIANSGVKPVILIHDFQVPGTDFGFDSMPDGRPFDLDLVRPYLNRIYGEGKWRHNYPTEVAGAMRGWVSIEPV